ncbi:MAG: DNA polymerase I [Clostridium sp.]|nr:DNA polymerase I [Clostridium sp.]MCM1444559.1 DNA polymerase I [Candidatus Amulumruptor caecigallinarius]
MDKIILVDGNNLIFRSYYATAYNGNFMKNSKGFPTNAIFGFVNMINKIILEEKPELIMVAFDKGKTFRHEKYKEYKAGRIEMPDELKVQIPVAKQILDKMGIKYYEIDNYEADDIIGTFSKFCDNINYIGTIISSDKDLLQLVNESVDIKLLKSKDYIRYNPESFYKDYGINPINIIDLKALMGDSSDNIKGVKGIGEKTALKLLNQYKTLDGIYKNIDKITGKIKEKLLEGKDDAYISYDLATIVTNVPLSIEIEDIKYKGNQKGLNDLYEELEFYSFLKKEKQQSENISKPFDIKIVSNVNEININSKCAVYVEIFGSNYHNSEVLGMGVYNENTSLFIPLDILKKNPTFLKDISKYTYDIKKTYVSLKWNGIDISNMDYDTMLAGYLLDYNIKDDIAYLANQFDYDIPFYETTYGKFIKLVKPNIDIIAYNTVLKAKFIYESHDLFIEKLKNEEMLNLFSDVEVPLSYTLGDMEYNGVYVDKNILKEMGEDINKRAIEVSKSIYDIVGYEFNISSPVQLGEVLFEKLNLPHGKKGKTGYSTAAEVLNKLVDKHPIINLVIEYRMLTKLYSTYIEGLLASVHKDNKIHTIYTQALTRTGRLSSIEPNLQNIPIRYEYGKLIRKAFVPSKDSLILSSDYSQIELRILAHTADVKALIDAFNNGIDIHTKTASDIFHVSIDDVTKDMRRVAKAVNFGIIYGISSYGLSENLGIKAKEAGEFINSYLGTYPGIKKYMDDTISNAHITKYVKTMFNRKRNIPELDNKNYMIRSGAERIALNTPIQGTSADIIKMAMVNVDKKIKDLNLKSKMILQVHDELIFDVLETELETIKVIVKDTMENVCKLSVPLDVDIEIGTNWYDAK